MHLKLKPLFTLLINIVWMSSLSGEPIEPESKKIPLGNALYSTENIANLVAAAWADYDQDGIPDLALIQAGGLRLYKGNPDLIYPNSPESQDRKRQGLSTRDLFVSVGQTIFLPEKVDFAGTGDFDADGHMDLVLAAKGGTAAIFLPGDGKGNFGIAERIELFGQVTSLAVGEINRRDGLNDVAVSIHGKAGEELLVFEGPNGAFKQKPERISIDSEATSIALGNLDDDQLTDIAVSCGSEIVLIHGRDRKLSLEEKLRRNVPAPGIERLGLPAAATAIRIGDFTGDHRKEIAVLSVDESVSYLEHGETWNLSSPAIHSARQIFSTARISGNGKDELVLQNQFTNQVNVLNDERGKGHSIDAAATVIAVLPMRLNPDAVDDLVVLKNTGVEVALSAPVHTFVVDDAGDSFDFSAGDSFCDIDDSVGDGPCTLRAAIEEANAISGDDEIQFNIGGGGPFTLQPSSAYSTINETLTIDGTTQPGFSGSPIIELDGSLVGLSASGVEIAAAGTVVRGLVINGFQNGIHVFGTSDVVLEGNYIGLDLDGNTVVPNLDHGIRIDSSSNCTIGGTTAAARNVISGNTNYGVHINASSTGIIVAGNYLGLNASGTSAAGNGNSGAALDSNADGNTIGGTAAGSRNVISGNAQMGTVIYFSSESNLIQGNYFGIDESGNNAVPNASHGVQIFANDNTVGGTTPAARNIISGNGNFGMQLCACGNSATGNVVQGNYIGLNAAGTSALPNNNVGLNLNEANSNLIGGTVTDARNVISGNGNIGIEIYTSSNNTVEGNYIGTNAAGTNARPNGGTAGVLIHNSSSNNLIGGDSPEARNVISGNTNIPGLVISDSGTTANIISANYIGLNAAGSSGLKNQVGILIDDSPGNTIGGETPEAGNVISKNSSDGIQIQGGNASGNQILNNIIGLNPAGTSALAQGTGILLNGLANNNTIGNAGAGNRIVANTVGISIKDGGTNNNVVWSNWIGWPSGSTPKGIGVRIGNDASGNQIGNADPDLGNRIENNGGAGILLKGSGTDFNTIRGNSISNNGGLGIDIQGTVGVSANDAGDGDNGPNDTMNFPVITTAYSDGETTTVQGALDTPSPENAVIDIYANSVVDPSGSGEGQDYLGSVSPDGSGNFSVSLDAIGEGSYVTATATDPGGNTSEFSTAVATVIALPALTISDVSVAEGNSGTVDAVFTVTLSAVQQVPVNVQYDTQDDSAFEGDDFNGAHGVLTIPAGSNSGTITVQVNGDTNEGEGDETFFVILSNPANAVINDNQGLGTILNDDGLPAFSINDVAVAEGDSGTNAYFTVTLSPTTGSNVTVNYSTSDGSAIAPGDYSSSSGVVTIPANTSEATIVIPIAGDNASEGDETFNVNLSNPSSGTVITDNQGAGVILESPDLVATPQSESSIHLAWSDPNEDEIGFRIERSNDGTNFNTVANVGANQNFYTDASLCGTCTYYYRVVPQTGLGSAPASNISVATTFPNNPSKVCLTQLSDTHTWARLQAVAYNNVTGKYGMAYGDRTGGNFDEMYFRLLNADGTGFGAPVQISETDMPTNFPSIAFNGANFGILYIEHMRVPNGPNAGLVKFALIDGTGSIIRREVEISGSKGGLLNNNLRHPIVWNGDSWGVFLSEDIGGLQELAYYRLDEDGDILAGPINITNTGGDFDGNISVAWNGTEYGMTWMHNSELQFQKMQADGTLVGSATSVNNNGNGMGMPSVVWNGAGWAIAWDEYIGGSDSWIYLRLLDSNGSPINSAQKISDEANPDVGFIDDELPALMKKPGGGYLIYPFTFECLDFCAAYEVTRLEADAGGNKVGNFTYLSTNDGLNSIYHDVATDGAGNFLLAYIDHANGTQEIADVVVDSSGAVVSNGGPHEDLTTGHWPGNAFLFGGASSPFTIPFQGGFVTMWLDISGGPTSQIYAKILDNSGSVNSTRFPLSSTGRSARGRPQAAVNGGQFAVAWKDNSNTVVFERYDGNGDSLGEIEVVTGAGGRPLVAIDFSGQEYAVAYVAGQNSRIAMRRLTADGTPVGSEIIVTSVNAGAISPPGPQIQWIGSGWAILWKQNGDLYYARLDSSGAVMNNPTQITFTGSVENNYELRWNGQVLGILFTQFGQTYFTVLDGNGLKAFTEIAIPDSSNILPSMYWDEAQGKFKIAFTRASQPSLFETEIDSVGTIGPTRMLAHRGGGASVAFDGKTAGLLWAGNNEMLFQTTECLNDGSAPACPANVAANYDGTKVAVTWDPSGDTESGIAKYFLYRDGLVIAELNPSTNSFIDYGFHQGTSYYEVRAMNGAYQMSIGCTQQAVVIGTPNTPSISINDVTMPEGDNGTTSFQFTISLSAPFNVDVNVDYATANGSALQGTDYTGITGACTIPANDTTCNVTVSVVGDTSFEQNEDFTVNLSNAVNATIADAQGVGTIQNDDGSPNLSINDVAIAEEDSATYLYFSVSLSTSSGSDVSVNYSTANGSAIAPNDYVGASETLTIPAGETIGTIVVEVVGDNISEGDETFFVNLSGATGDATIADNQGMGVILEATDLVASASSSSSINLTWTDPNESEIGFRIERSTNGTSFTNIGSVGANNITFTDGGRAAATLYYYRIVPFTSTSLVASSNIAVATTFPGTPAKVCAQQISNQHTWARNASAAWNGSKWGLVYQERTAISNDAILFQLLNADGTTSGSPITISTGDSSSQFPAIRWNGTNFAVSWLSRLRKADGGVTQVANVQFALLDANGNPLRTGVPVIGGPQTFLSSSLEIPMVWDGTNWGLFILENVNTPDEVVFYRLDSQGNLVNGPVNISNSPGMWDDSITADWNGTEYGVAWLRKNASGGSDLFFQRMQSDGTLIGAPTLLSSVAGIQSANVIWDGTNWIVVWDDISNGGIEEIVYLQKIDSSGVLVGSSHRLTDDTNLEFGTYDEIPRVFTKPGGGYVVYTLSVQCDESFCGAYEVGRLEADSNGDRLGSRTFLSDPDGKNSGYTTGLATDGAGNYLIAYPDGRQNTQEIADVVVDASGAVVAGGAIRDLTTGHSPGINLLMTSAAAPFIIPFQSGFVTMWNDVVAGPDSRIYAKIFDGNGNVSATKFPLTANDLRNRPAAVAVGNIFAVAWKSAGNGVRFARFDANGNLIGVEVEISTNGGGRPAIGLDFSGSEYGLAWIEDSNLLFQRLDQNGNLIGSSHIIHTTSSGFGAQGPQMYWTGSGWGILWPEGNEFYFARIDSSGATIIAPQQVTFSGFAKNQFYHFIWNGQEFGLVWQEVRGNDPPGADIYFTTMDLNGNKMFEENAVVSTYGGDSNPNLYWAGDRFKLVHFRGDSAATWELDVFPDGTTGSSRLLSTNPSNTYAANNGATVGVLMSYGRNEMYFETTQCLTDVTAPACPPASASFDGSKVTVSWSASSDAESGIQRNFVYRDGILLAEQNASTLSFEDFGFVAGATHDYEVRAMNGAYLESSGCTVHQVTIAGGSVPSGLTNNTAADVNACADSGAQVTWAQDPADWGDSGSGTRAYDVLRDGSPIASALAYGTTQYTDTTGVNGTTYTYTVKYNNGLGFSATTNPGATASDAVSAAPSGIVSPTAGDSNSCTDDDVVVTWNQDPSDWGDNGNGTRTYDVLRDGTPIGSALAYGTTQFTDTTGINGTTYDYTIRYNNGCGQSSTSGSAFAVDNVATAPSGLTNNGASDLSSGLDTGVFITWSQDPADWGDSGSGTRTYDVLRDGNPIATGLAYATTQFTDTTGVNGTTYTYTVRYNNGCGLNATTSPGATAADVVGVSPPTGLSNNSAVDDDDCGDTGIQVSWSQDPADWADGGSGTRTYDVLRDGSPIQTAIAYATTSYIDTTGTNGTSYTYTVRYNNGVGGSATTTPGATTADMVGSVPSGLSNNSAADVGACADTGVLIAWSQDPADWGDNGNGTRTYDVLRDGTPVAAGLTYGTTQFTDTTGTNGTSYTYTVRYNNGCGVNALSTGVSASDDFTPPVSETANQLQSPRTAVNQSNSSDLGPAFTILGGQAASATVTWTLTGTTDLTNCARVELRASDGVTKIMLKNYNEPDTGTADVLAFYQTYGPGTVPYRVIVTEKNNCQNTASTDSASIASTQLVVQEACP